MTLKARPRPLTILTILSAAGLFAFVCDAAWAQKLQTGETVTVPGKYLPGNIAFWAPDPAHVQKADAAIGPMIDFADHQDCSPTPITEFSRTYVGFTNPKSGQREIIGQYDRLKSYPGATGGIHISSKPV